ncbi:MAG: hypothetical protein K2K91_03855 [Ruminococcus sp.]|nr:hypothetical protein [Ruminococcus sp.]
MDNYGESPVITALKGLVGAVIGAIPGMLIWIILGKIGFVFSAVGILIGLGIFIGYGFMVKNADALPIWLMLVIFFVVFAIAMILSEKIVWTWELADTFKEYLPTYREDIITGVLAESDMTRAEVESILTDELFTEFVEENFGVKEGTFGECFSNFSTLLENLDMKGKYIASLLKSSLFGIVGGIGVFAKMGK